MDTQIAPEVLPVAAPEVAAVATQAIAPAVEAALEPTPFGSIERTQDLTAAIEESGLDYTLECITVCPKGEPDEEIPGFKAVRRTDTKTVFNIPTDAYEIAQNREVLEFAAPVIRETAGTYTRMGFFKKGASIFAFAELLEKLVLTEKLTMHQNIVIQSSHDGSASVTIRFLATGDETITENLILPYNSERGRVSYRHTRHVHLRMDEVAALILKKNAYFTRLKEDSQSLIKSAMDDAQARRFVNELLEINDGESDDKISSSKVESRDTILRLFRDGHLYGVANTKYAMLIAVANQRSNHARTRKVGKDTTEAEARFSSVFGGASASDIDWAWSRLLKLSSE